MFIIFFLIGLDKVYLSDLFNYLDCYNILYASAL